MNKYFIGVSACTAIGVAGIASYVFFGYHEAYKEKDFETVYERSKMIEKILPETKQTLYYAVCSEILHKYIQKIEASGRVYGSRNLVREWPRKINKVGLKWPMPNKDIQDFYTIFKTLQDSGLGLDRGIPHEGRIWGERKENMFKYTYMKRSLPLLKKIDSEESNYLACLYGAHIVEEHLYEIISCLSFRHFNRGREYAFSDDDNEREIEEISEEISKKKKKQLEHMIKVFNVLYTSLEQEMKQLDGYIKDGKYKSIYLAGAHTNIYKMIESNGKVLKKYEFLLESEKLALKNMNTQLYELTISKKIEYDVLKEDKREELVNLEKIVNSIIK